MKITPVKISNYKYNNFNFTRRIYKKQQQDSFEKTAFVDENNYLIQSPSDLSFFLNAKGKVTFEEYQKIKLNNPALIEKAEEYIKEEVESNNNIDSNYKSNNSYKLNSTPKSIVNAAEFFKAQLENKYPARNYKIISLGTSPAILAFALKNLGCDVDFIPASKLNQLEIDDSFDIFNYGLFKKYPNLKVLINLFKKAIKNDDRNYVIIDFVFTGISFETLEKIFKKTKNFQNNKIDFLEINDLNQSFYKDKGNPIVSDCGFTYIFDVTNVPHFDLSGKLKQAKDYIEYNGSMEEFEKALENYSKPLARAYELCIIDEIQKKSKANALDQC